MVNAPELHGNWFWQVGLVARKFYWLEVNPKDSPSKRFPTLSKTTEVLGSDLCGV